MEFGDGGLWKSDVEKVIEDCCLRSGRLKDVVKLSGEESVFRHAGSAPDGGGIEILYHPYRRRKKRESNVWKVERRDEICMPRDMVLYIRSTTNAVDLARLPNPPPPPFTAGNRRNRH